MFLHKTPHWITGLFPQITWSKPLAGKTIYLTFDDGPVPEATPHILRHLKTYNARATFFCVGENLQKYPHVLQQVLAGGHSLGNHTFNHLDGWRYAAAPYIQNVARCQQQLDKFARRLGKPLLRPPYGRINFKQLRLLSREYEIVMWDVLSGDFHAGTNAQTCLTKSCMSVSNGSIVVFHDSRRSIEKVNFVLPRFLSYFSEKGFAFEPL